jgi:hypothetical protein
MRPVRLRAVGMVALAAALVGGCTAASPGSSADPSSSVSVTQAEFPSDCPPIDLRGPSGELIDLTGEWAGSGVLAQDNEVALLNQIGECVYGSVSGFDTDEDATAVTNLTGLLHPDFSMNVELAIVQQTGTFKFGELSAIVMVVEWDDAGRLRLREVRDPVQRAGRCIQLQFDCPAPVIWYRTDETL